MSQMNQDTNNGSRKAHTLYITELERQAQEAQDKEPTNEAAQEVAAPKRSFRMAKDDKTVRLLIGFAGVVAVALIMLILFSDKGKPRTKKNAEASLGRPRRPTQSPQPRTALWFRKAPCSLCGMTSHSRDK